MVLLVCFAVKAGIYGTAANKNASSGLPMIEKKEIEFLPLGSQWNLTVFVYYTYVRQSAIWNIKYPIHLL